MRRQEDEEDGRGMRQAGRRDRDSESWRQMEKSMKVVYVDYIFEDENIEKRIFNEAGIEFINASGFNYEETKRAIIKYVKAGRI